jgi:large subunit ribosomal protein L24
MNIKKGDSVKILAGKDRGKTGTVLKAIPGAGRILIEGMNVYTKRMRPKKQNQKGQVIDVPRSLHASNVMLVCPNCKKPSRTSVRMEGNNKSRFCKKCQATV